MNSILDLKYPELSQEVARAAIALKKGTISLDKVLDHLREFAENNGYSRPQLQRAIFDFLEVVDRVGFAEQKYNKEMEQNALSVTPVT